MNRSSDRLFLRLAIVGVAVAALGLAGCGRKGPLDPPPGASLASASQDDVQAASPGMPGQTAPIVGQTRDGSVGAPPAPRGPVKRIFLDDLLN